MDPDDSALPLAVLVKIFEENQIKLSRLCGLIHQFLLKLQCKVDNGYNGISPNSIHNPPPCPKFGS